ncbi:MAG: hypothetical protein PUD10_05895 [Lachnospira sp.]|nr:hypothetical protein [Lachnospira sp.]
MSYYSLTQWLLFFYIYCFIGWIWECCYVSVRKREWVNRGFLHGPFLPIYGSGAIVILLSTINVRDSIPLIFIMGMISSTILEFVTGCCMEKLFGVRYWDYSDKPFNVKGHICLFVSIGWGFFSVLLVKVVHRPIESLVMMIPVFVVDIISFILTVIIAIDFTQSFNEAMDLKATLERFTKTNEAIKTVSKRLEVVYAFAEEDYRKYKENKEKKAEQKAEQRAEALSEIKSKTRHISIKEKMQSFERSMSELKNTKLESLQNISERAKEYFKNSNGDENTKEGDNSLNQIISSLDAQKESMSEETTRDYRKILKIIRRNPNATSKKHSEALADIKKLIK